MDITPEDIEQAELVGADAPGAPPMPTQPNPAEQLDAIEKMQTGLSMEALKDVGGDLVMSLMYERDKSAKLSALARSLLPKD